MSTRGVNEPGAAPGVPGAPTFEYRDGVLCCEEVPLDRLYRAVGPAYVYSTERLRANARRVLKAFSRARTLVCFALKSNSNPALVRLFRDLGLGAEVSSGAELEIALHCGIKPSQIVSSGNARTARELRQAAAARAFLVSLDSEEEIARLEEEAARLREAGQLPAPVRAAIRMNPDIDPGVHPDIATGMAEAKFGIPAERALDWYLHPERTPHLQWVGVHVHVGSQVVDTEPLLAMLGSATDIVDELAGAGVRLEVMNLGGGFGVDYDGTGSLAIERFADAACMVANNSGMTIVVEPGRFLVADACALVGQVLFVKRGRKSFVVSELGMNDLIRPALYDAYHAVIPVREPAPARVASGRTEVMDVVGPICESGDVLARDRALVPPAAGSLIALAGAGAYGYTMASNYNGRPRLAEVLVNGSQAKLVRRGESWQDLVRLAAETEIDLPGGGARQPVRVRPAAELRTPAAGRLALPVSDGTLRGTLRAELAAGLARRRSRKRLEPDGTEKSRTRGAKPPTTNGRRPAPPSRRKKGEAVRRRETRPSRRRT